MIVSFDYSTGYPVDLSMYIEYIDSASDKSMTIALLYSDGLKEYDFGPGHSFRGERYQVFSRFLRNNLAEDGNYRIIEAQPATDDELLRICDRDYINFTRDFYKAANLGIPFDGQFYRYHSADNRPMEKCGKLEEAARLVIGQAKLACDLIQSGEFATAVGIGGGLHHAKRHYGEGFCIYNDVAYTAYYLLENYGVERIVILDTDAHAGNGTSDYFYGDPRVLMIDLHQDPRTIYPGTGFSSDIGYGSGKGYTVNVPLPLFSGDDSYQLIFEKIVHPLISEFMPQVIIRNGGSDPHWDDRLTSLGVTVNGFHMIGEQVRLVAQHCGSKQIDLIASGYNEEVLPYAWLALISGIAGFHISPSEWQPVLLRYRNDKGLNETTHMIEEVKHELKDYWHCFR